MKKQRKQSPAEKARIKRNELMLDEIVEKEIHGQIVQVKLYPAPEEVPPEIWQQMAKKRP